MEKILKKVLVMSSMFIILLQQFCYAYSLNEFCTTFMQEDLLRLTDRDILIVKIVSVAILVVIGILVYYFSSTNLKKDNSFLKNIRKACSILGIIIVISMFFNFIFGYQFCVLDITKMSFEGSFLESFIQVCIAIYLMALYVSPFFLIYDFGVMKKNNGTMKLVNVGILIISYFMAFISIYNFVLKVLN